MKKNILKSKYFLVLLFFILCFIFIIYLVIYALRQNINLFYTPSQIYLENIIYNKNIKIGGFVKKDSIIINDTLDVFFDITDYKNSVHVEYSGILPDLFDEDKGVVVIGTLEYNNNFKAKQVLAKHDENYVPRDTVMSK